MKKNLSGVLLMFLIGIVLLLSSIVLTISYVPSTYAMEEDCDPGWLEVRDIVRCHCPDESHRCECCYPQQL